jgi:cell division septation protein DedD
MAAVLLELGFMDSATDVPIILTEKYADQCATAIVKVIVKRGKLKKKVVEQPKPAEPEKECIYRVQVGAYSNTSNAEAMLDKLEKAGFPGVIVKEEK